MAKNHGVQAEDAVEVICYQLFGKDLVLRSPLIFEPSGPKELSDILVLVDDTAIIIQSKSVQIDATELDETKFARIRRRHFQAITQLNTALNAQNRNATVRATTSTGISFDIDWSRIRHKIGIITLNIPDSAYDDPEFRFQYPYLLESHNGIEVHTFLLNDFKRMSSELTTPADFLLYLRTRLRLLQSQRIIMGNELDMLALFKTQYPVIENALSDPTYHIWITPGYWEEYHEAHRDERLKREERFQNSFLIDRLIELLRTSVDYSAQKQGISTQDTAINFMTLIGKLSKLTRMERAKIGDKIIEKAKKTKTARYGYFIYISQLMNIGYLFLLLNEENRETRRKYLYYFCEQACHIAPCRNIVGIATEGAQLRGASFDTIILDVEATKARTQRDPEVTLFQQAMSEQIDEWSS